MTLSILRTLYPQRNYWCEWLVNSHNNKVLAVRDTDHKSWRYFPYGKCFPTKNSTDIIIKEVLSEEKSQILFENLFIEAI